MTTPRDILSLSDEGKAAFAARCWEAEVDLVKTLLSSEDNAGGVSEADLHVTHDDFSSSGGSPLPLSPSPLCNTLSTHSSVPSATAKERFCVNEEGAARGASREASTSLTATPARASRRLLRSPFSTLSRRGSPAPRRDRRSKALRAYMAQPVLERLQKPTPLAEYTDRPCYSRSEAAVHEAASCAQRLRQAPPAGSFHFFLQRMEEAAARRDAALRELAEQTQEHYPFRPSISQASRRPPARASSAEYPRECKGQTRASTHRRSMIPSEPTFKPAINARSEAVCRGRGDLLRDEINRRKRLDDLRVEKARAEAEHLTFSPQVNERSALLASMRCPDGRTTHEALQAHLRERGQRRMAVVLADRLSRQLEEERELLFHPVTSDIPAFISDIAAQMKLNRQLPALPGDPRANRPPLRF